MTFFDDVAVYQVNAESLVAAIETWVTEIVNPDYYEMNNENMMELQKEMLEYQDPVRVEDTVNVWCYAYLLRDEVMFIYIVKTRKS